MSRKHIRVEEVAEEWMKKAEFVKEYDALGEEIALADAFIRARAQANLAQERVGTTQVVTAWLESGRVRPPTHTLERLVKATGAELRIRFGTGARESNRRQR